MSQILLHNTLSRRKEPLQTERPDRVTLYVCGPTVYNYAHIGNARPAVVFDVLARLLRHDYRELLYARNFTDVDDKINAAAAAAGVPIGSITARYIDAYHEDMQALGVLAPDIEPRVTAHIGDIIALVQTLIERGHAYVAEGHVLFEVASYPEYGHLSGRRVEDMLAGARVEVAPYKRDALDFVLWKPSDASQPGWDSPWGRGRPGWHVECTAMIGQHLGHTIDIHGGGQDLIFPHHENEIAQGTCAHGGLYCRTWVHNSFVTVDGQKMSKSLGNVLLVRDLLQQSSGEAIRLALLATHYRRPLDWNEMRLQAAQQTLARLQASLARAADVEADADTGVDDEVLQALRNDLNVSAALARLQVLARQLDAAREPAARRQAKAQLLASGALLGLLQQPVSQPALKQQLAAQGAERQQAEALLAARERARQARDFARADALRAELAQLGFQVEDRATGPQLRAAEPA
ncbi:cysteine--tRNA ligase [Pseudomonas sp. PA15(2017)]|uniref:cysteine--tRNA ligase n=1 Tax=Pseudomonas sp. PA15(2017) TaxID=1932111 RepID=UPI0009607785|nr:cysteine--tRNA ligase [Pseudomonas sp. PA15(2017)]OLU22376.1 cysteine--tRNA ligase [Pseudomonas sp. PA15(2017)]